MAPHDNALSQQVAVKETKMWITYFIELAFRRAASTFLREQSKILLQDQYDQQTRRGKQIERSDVHMERMAHCHTLQQQVLNIASRAKFVQDVIRFVAFVLVRILHATQ